MAKTSGLNVTVNVDVSEALTGLKALQREAKKATQALAELNAAQNPVITAESLATLRPVHYLSGLREYSTQDLELEVQYRKLAEATP